LDEESVTIWRPGQPVKRDAGQVYRKARDFVNNKIRIEKIRDKLAVNSDNRRIQHDKRNLLHPATSTSITIPLV
jgi:hypothetical protein